MPDAPGDAIACTALQPGTRVLTGDELGSLLDAARL